MEEVEEVNKMMMVEDVLMMVKVDDEGGTGGGDDGRGSHGEGGGGPYLPRDQLQRVLLEGLEPVEPGCDDLLQLLEGVGLEGKPGQTLNRGRGHVTGSCDGVM